MMSVSFCVCRHLLEQQEWFDFQFLELFSVSNWILNLDTLEGKNLKGKKREVGNCYTVVVKYSSHKCTKNESTYHLFYIPKTIIAKYLYILPIQ